MAPCTQGLRRVVALGARHAKALPGGEGGLELLESFSRLRVAGVGCGLGIPQLPSSMPYCSTTTGSSDEKSKSGSGEKEKEKERERVRRRRRPFQSSSRGRGRAGDFTRKILGESLQEENASDTSRTQERREREGGYQRRTKETSPPPSGPRSSPFADSSSSSTSSSPSLAVSQLAALEDEVDDQRRRRRKRAIERSVRSGSGFAAGKDRRREMGVKRTNRRRGKDNREEEDAFGRTANLRQKLLAEEQEREEDMQIMLEYLESKASGDFDDEELAAEEEEVVVEILTSLHRNLSVEFERNQNALLEGMENGSGGDGGGDSLAVEGDFLEQFRSIMDVSDEEWKQISEGAVEDIRKAKRKLRRRYPHLIQDTAEEKKKMNQAAVDLKAITLLNHEDRQKELLRLLKF